MHNFLIEFSTPLFLYPIKGKGEGLQRQSGSIGSLKEKATSPFRPLVQTMESVENSFGVYAPFPQSSLTPRNPLRLFLIYSSKDD